MTATGKSLALVMALAACSVGPVENEEVDTSTAPQIAYTSFGGLLGVTLYLVVDSTSSTARVYCTAPRVRGEGGDCRATPERTVPLPAQQLRALFATTSASRFLNARSTYDTSPGLVDGPTYELKITRNGTTRTIVWSRATDLDQPVRDFLVNVLGTAGFTVDAAS
jgi:hypothetical protein